MSLYGRLMYARERRLTLRDKNRRVFPFEWGLKWLVREATRPPLQELKDYAARSVANSREFFAPGPITDARVEDGCLTFSTPKPTPYDFNNRVSCRLFEAEVGRAAVVVVPQWNSDPDGHVSLCRVLQKLGITGVRLTMPYHDDRRPPGMKRADYMVSPNVGRTLHATRQAVLETIQVAGWLRDQGYEKVAVMGTSIGSCVAYLAFLHDPLIACGVFNHVSSHFADVVWRGLSTRFVRWGLEQKISLEDLRDCWAPISPAHYIRHLTGDRRPHRLITAKYDLSFPRDLSELVFQEYDRLGLDYDRVDLPCGHYTTATFPFNWLDGWHICSYLYRKLRRG